VIDKSVVSSSLSEPDRLAVVVVDKTNPKTDIVSMFSTERGEQNLQQILQQQIDWHRGIEFLATTERQLSLLQDLHSDHQEWKHGECHVYSLWPLTRLPVPAPAPPQELALLSPGHAPLLAATWKFTDEGTVAMLEQQLGLGRVLGLFQPGDTNPVAWMMTYSHGSLGMLHVDPAYRRRGLATYLVSKLVEQANQAGLLPYIEIEDDNNLSQTMMTKLGFNRAEKAIFVNNNKSAPGFK